MDDPFQAELDRRAAKKSKDDNPFEAELNRRAAEKAMKSQSAPEAYDGTATNYERFSAQADPLPAEPSLIEQGWNGLKNYMTGANADPGVSDLPEFSADSVPGDMSQSVALAFRQLLNSTEEGKAEAVKAMFPDVNLEQDSYGNMIVVLPSGERRTINRPGPSPQDAYQFLTEIMAFAGAGKLARVGKIPTMAGRATGEATVAGGVELGRSAVSPDEDVDIARAAITAGGGFGGQILGDVIGKVFARTPKIKDGDGLSQAARDALDEAEIDSADIPAEFIDAWTRKARTHGISPSTARRVLLDEFDIRTTRAPVTGRSADWSAEDAMERGGKGVPAQNIMQGARETETQSVLSATDKLAQKQAPGIDTRADAGDVVMGGLRKESADQKAQITRAYSDENIPRGGLFVSNEYVATIPDRMLKRLDAEDVDTTPVALEMFPQTRSALDQFKRLADETPDGLNVGDTFLHDIHRLERQRRVLNRKISAADNAEDKRAVTIMKREFDEAISDFIDEGLFSGDMGVLANLKEARKLRAEYGRLFGVHSRTDDAGKTIEKIISEGRTPEEVGDYIAASANLTATSMGNADRLAKRIAEIVGKDSDEFKALKAGVFRAVIQNQAHTPKGYKTMSRDLARFVDSSLGRTLFKSEEISELRRFARAVSILVPPEKAINHSGSGAAVMGMALDMMAKIPMFTGVAMGDPMLAAVGAVSAVGRRQAVESASQFRAARVAKGSPLSTKKYPSFGSFGSAGANTAQTERRR